MPSLTPGARARLALTVLVAAFLLTASPAAAQLRAPWFNAKVGTMIRYRVTEEKMPGMLGAPRSKTITEEVTAVTDSTVTVKVTRSEAGQSDQTSTITHPRTLTTEQSRQIDAMLGSTRNPKLIKTVSGHEFECFNYRRTIESPDGNHDIWYHTIKCSELPGWIFVQSKSRADAMGGETLYEILEYRP